MKLKLNKGKVSFIMAAGKDFVRSEMEEKAANDIVKKSKAVDTNSIKFDGFSVCVDDTYYFPGLSDKKKTLKPESENMPTE